MRSVTFLAAISGALAVIAGAMGAHYVHGPGADWMKTGGQYQLIHAVAALVAGRMGAKVPAWLFVVGGAVFAGTLYLMAFGLPHILGAVTPIGGVLMIIGWIWLAFDAAKGRIS